MIRLRYSNRSLVIKGSTSYQDKNEAFGIIMIGILALWLIITSWRKWSDPQIDFGREVYIPWRMLNGAHWLTDIDDLYGPLSRFIDTVLFKLFGPSIMVIVWANIASYVVTLAVLYRLFKQGWGFVVSLASCFIFVSVFSFSQLTATSNYNFITPYSHQVIHGFLVCLFLVWILHGWVFELTLTKSVSIGLLIGLTALLKPEFILCAIFLTGAAWFWSMLQFGEPRFGALALIFLGALLPTLLFTLYFMSYLSVGDASAAACHAWLNGLFIWKDALTAHLLDNFSGMDNPSHNAYLHGFSTLKALALLGAIWLLSWLSNRLSFTWMRYTLVLLAAELLVKFGLWSIGWAEIGRVFLGLLAIYGCFKALVWFLRGRVMNDPKVGLTRLLMSVFAVSLMARMVLNGRVYQYGFCQASIAAMVIVAVLLGEVPEGSFLKDFARKVYISLISVLLFTGNVCLIMQSQALLAAKTASIGQDGDQFYSFPVQIGGNSEIISHFTEFLRKQPDTESLIVLPEGITLNYLSRKKSPVPELLFYVSPQLEDKILVKLRANPPTWVVFLSRDLTEYGVSHYGAKGQSGDKILDYIITHYSLVDSMGGDPSGALPVGGRLYKRNDLGKLRP